MSGESSLDLSKGALPILKVVGICTFVFFVAWWARGLQNTAETTASDVAEIKRAVSDFRDERLEQQLEIRDVQREVKDLRMQHNLLKDYTEGRISHLPYRPQQIGDPR